MKRMFMLMIVLLSLCGCSTVIEDNEIKGSDAADAYQLSLTESDLDASYDINGSTYISLGDQDVKINRGGTYILEGTMNGAGIIVEVSKDEEVQLVLNNVTIENDDFAGIYIVEAGQVTITLPEGTVNSISDSGEYAQIDSNQVDALIYSKADLTINGTGTLTLNSDLHHGIVSKDDLLICGGSYQIDVAGKGLGGKDCLMISDGDFRIVSGKDALSSDNEEDEYKGYVSISGGTFHIESGADGIYGYSLVSIEDGTFDITTAKSLDADSFKAVKSEKSVVISGGSFQIDSADDGIHSDGDLSISGGNFDIVSDDDGIHADGKVTIEGGTIAIEAHEGIEGTYVLISGGDVSIEASDDGINAAQKVNDYVATVEISGGHVQIRMGQGDTDAIDSNGYIYISGGTIEIEAQFPFDYDKGAEHSGGTIIVNGEETEEISNQFGGGFGGGFPGGTDFPGEGGGEAPPDSGDHHHGFPGGH